MSKPTVAAIHGYCIGSGVEIALLCDLRIAAEGTIFSLPEVQLGMIPAAGGTQTLPRSIRRSAALEILLTGRRLEAREALSLRLLTRVVPQNILVEQGWALARQLAELDVKFAADAKDCVRLGADLPLSQALLLETRAAARSLA